MKTRIYLNQADYGRGVDVRIVQQDADNHVVAEAKVLSFQPAEDGAQWREPVITMRRDLAQDLMDELWRLGYRPADGQMSVGQMQATERHLADFRAIAFAKLEITKP